LTIAEIFFVQFANSVFHKFANSQMNPIVSAFTKIEKLPTFMQSWAKDFALKKTVPYVATTGVKFEKTEKNEWIASIKNKRKVGNHLKQIHAGAMIVLAESVSVMLTAMNMPSGRVPLVKTIHADFVKRSTGNMRASAKLTNEQIQFIQDNEKGELEIVVEVFDEADVQPILVTVTSAWIPKKRK
jgi:acyl-coenzyme A thioesterase PaaI-like protein